MLPPRGTKYTTPLNGWINFEVLWQAIFQIIWIKTIRREKFSSFWFSSLSVQSLCHWKGIVFATPCLLLSLLSCSFKDGLWSLPCLHWKFANCSSDWGVSVCIQASISAFLSTVLEEYIVLLLCTYSFPCQTVCDAVALLDSSSWWGKQMPW